MSKTEYISIRHASLGYKKPAADALVLQDIDLTCCSGDLVGVVGRNGTGKSTLIRSIAGLLPVLSGDILIAGKSVSQLSIEEKAKLVSVVLTEKITGFNLNVFDIVASGQIPYTDSFHRLKPANLAVIERCIERCGISSYRFKAISELSDGMFQKAIIAKSLAQQTPLMLLDEPSAFLDYASKHQLFILLQQLCTEENKCILVSSHDLDLILKYCNRLLILSENRIELINSADARSNKTFNEIAGGFL